MHKVPISMLRFDPSPRAYARRHFRCSRIARGVIFDRASLIFLNEVMYIRASSLHITFCLFNPPGNEQPSHIHHHLSPQQLTVFVQGTIAYSPQRSRFTLELD